MTNIIRLFGQHEDASFQSQDIKTYKLRELNIWKLLFKLQTSTLGELGTHKRNTLK